MAHPDLVPVAEEIFDRVPGRPPPPEGASSARTSTVTAADLLDFRVEGGRITEAGVRANVRIALQYLDSWLQGHGAVAIHNLMEDTATAEISRAQLWQWICNDARLDDGRAVTTALYRESGTRSSPGSERPRSGTATRRGARSSTRWCSARTSCRS